VKVKKSGAFTIKSAQVGCPAESPGPCQVEVAVLGAAASKPGHGRASKALSYGSSKLVVAVGKTISLSGRISSRALKILKQHRKLKVSIRVSATVPGSESSVGLLAATLVPTSSPRR
jgi:hypothetical protein